MPYICLKIFLVSQFVYIIAKQTLYAPAKLSVLIVLIVVIKKSLLKHCFDEGQYKFGISVNKNHSTNAC